MKNINVDVVYGGWLSNHVGPSRSLRRFSKNKPFFLNRGMELSIISFDLTHERSFSSKSLSMVGLLRRKLINAADKLTIFSDKLTKVIIQKRYLRHGRSIVDFYLSKEREADVIVFHEIFSCYYYLKKRKSTKSKVLMMHHANGEIFKMLESYYPRLSTSYFYEELNQLKKYVLDHLDVIGFISENARRNFLSLHPFFDKSKTRFFHNGIEDSTAHVKRHTEKNSADLITLVCVGTINDRKGQEMLVEAFNLLTAEKRNKLKLIFLGDGPKKGYLETLTKKYNLDEFIEFKGAVDNVDDYLYCSDIFVLPSLDEGLPLSIIEAMRIGLPIIGTDVAGVPELIEIGVNGFVVEPNIDSLVKILNDIRNYNFIEMGLASRKIFLEKFTLEVMMDNYIKVIKDTKEI